MKTSEKKDSVASAGLHQRALGSQSSGVNNQVKSNENSLLFVIENNLWGHDDHKRGDCQKNCKRSSSEPDCCCPFPGTLGVPPGIPWQARRMLQRSAASTDTVYNPAAARGPWRRPDGSRNASCPQRHPPQGAALTTVQTRAVNKG